MSLGRGDPTNPTAAPVSILGDGSVTSSMTSSVQGMSEIALSEGNGYTTAVMQKPLTRKVVASVRASLAELCNARAKATWAPSQEALGLIFKQTKFVDLSGKQTARGDLKSCVLHSVSANSVKSTFPISLGVDITGVDPNTYSASGNAFSTIVLPKTESVATKVLQEDDPKVAYDFMNRYPGYNAHNLETNGVHAVPQRNFVLISSDHPIMTAIDDNKQQLQTGDLNEMPEGLVKMSTSLYDAVMPVVRQQVESQVRVRDYSRASVSISPSDYSSWNAAMEQLTKEAVKPLKEERRRALACKGADVEKVNADFDAEEQKVTSEVQHKPREFHIELEHRFNFMGA